jgi:predicted AlkP superfamily pyrophosphatase or phosphodiesterase
MRLSVLLLAAAALQAQPRKLLVISIDGLDTRYLHQADKLGMKIPTLRRLMAEGAVADGVVGIVPTVTWPSHTTLISGVEAAEHGIVGNDQPGQPGQRWWFTSFLTARTLWHAAAEKKRKTATVYWPVTVGATVDFNFPEFWETRGEHEVLFAPIAAKATPGLEAKVTNVYPSFPRALWTDTGAMQAVRYLLEFEQPDLTLVHIADLDSEEHDYGAFSKPAKAVLEHADELVGWTLQKLPRGTIVAIVSDHGFENIDHVVRPKALRKDLEVSQGLIGAKDADAAAFLRAQIGKHGIAREVPMEEVRALAPQLSQWTAAFDTAPGHVPSADDRGPAVSAGAGKGTHGLWPTRANYRASFILWGQGVKKAKLGEISMLDVAPTLAEITGLDLPAAKRKSLWPKVR